MGLRIITYHSQNIGHRPPDHSRLFNSLWSKITLKMLKILLDLQNITYHYEHVEHMFTHPLWSKITLQSLKTEHRCPKYKLSHSQASWLFTAY